MPKILNIIIIICLQLLILECCLQAQNNTGGTIRIIPEPVKMIHKPGAFLLDSLTQIVNLNDIFQINEIAAFLNQKLETCAGFKLNITNQLPTSNVIVLTIDSSLLLHDEGYTMDITFQMVSIKAKTSKGLFYGLQTLFQLLPPEIESKSLVKSIQFSIPCVSILDYPRFKYRGMHLDVSRHFFRIDFIKKQLDMMSMYKLNTFHWHLTDDQGWRIEIKKYPKLTEVGSKRTEPDGSVYGGFYTQEEIKDIIAYAKARYIDILPEIDMPGHAMAALASYPENSCTGGPFQVRNIWGIETESFCPGNEQTYNFINDIIDEIAVLFPYEYIHIGGDECLKDRWKSCPYCQNRKRDQGLKSEKELQSYFVKRVEKLVLAHGKRIIGWDEILEGGLAPDATVMSWRDEKGGLAAANQNHEVIMCPQKWLYLDHYQGSEKVEPVALKGLVTLEDVYKYNPVPKKLLAEKLKYVIGTQANIWSEYLYTPEKVEYIAYPRIIAFAEVAWSLKKNKKYFDFLDRLYNQFPRLDFDHINYHIPLPEGPANVEAFIDTISVSFSTSRPIHMVYTLDGSNPDTSSSTYEKPFHFSNSKIIKIRTVLPTGEMSAIRTIKVEKQAMIKSTEINSNPGLQIRQTYGKYNTVMEVDTAKIWSDSIIYDIKTKFNYHKPSAAIMSGYLNVPKSGIYYFSTNVEQLWIHGRLLIANEGEVKNHSRNDASIALSKGKHEIKMIFLNNIVGGRPAATNGIRLFYRLKSELKPKLAEAPMLSH